MARYRLVEQIGTGGMSVVWRAVDEVLQREVAVKVLARDAGADVRMRLPAEARAVAKLSHPYIAPVFDYGELADGDGARTPYVVMELVPGASLAQRLKGDPLPWRETVRIGAQVAAALACAHARGIVHRDVTPGNVLVTAAGAKVVDFGIAAAIGDQERDADGTLLGTPAYLAPERLAGGTVGTAGDVYALGLLIYRCLRGRLPWSASTATAMLRAHQYAEPEALPPLPGVPDEVIDLCHACIARDPADRPAAIEVAYALADVVGLVLPLPEAPVRPRPAVPSALMDPRWPQPAGKSTAVLPADLVGTSDRTEAAAPPEAPIPALVPAGVAAGLASWTRSRVLTALGMGAAIVALVAVMVVAAAWDGTPAPAAPALSAGTGSVGPAEPSPSCRVRPEAPTCDQSPTQPTSAVSPPGPGAAGPAKPGKHPPKPSKRPK